MNTVDFDCRVLELAVKNPVVFDSFWRDVLRGIGRAFDPLPAEQGRTFCENDQIAFMADAIKLDIDKEHALSPFQESLPVFKQRDYVKKVVNAKASHAFAKAG